MEWLRELVRPTSTWAIIALVGYGFVKGMIPWDALAPIATAIIVFWFESRTIEKTVGRTLKNIETIIKNNK